MATLPPQYTGWETLGSSVRRMSTPELVGVIQDGPPAERLAALSDAVVANYDARRLVAERFRAARGDLIDVLQAENDYFEAAVACIAGLADRDMASYALMEHTGELLEKFSPGEDRDAAPAP